MPRREAVETEKSRNNQNPPPFIWISWAAVSLLFQSRKQHEKEKNVNDNDIWFYFLASHFTFCLLFLFSGTWSFLKSLLRMLLRTSFFFLLLFWCLCYRFLRVFAFLHEVLHTYLYIYTYIYIDLFISLFFYLAVSGISIGESPSSPLLCYGLLAIFFFFSSRFFSGLDMG